MRFLLKVKKAYATSEQVAASSTGKALILFRGVQDISPGNMNPKHKGEGLFGSGTYYALDYETAEDYAIGRYHADAFSSFAFVCKYKIGFKSLLQITQDQAIGLSSAHGMINVDDPILKKKLGVSKFQADTLTKLCKKFDGVMLTGESNYGIDGGDQVILPPGSKATAQLISLTMYVHDTDIRDKIATKIKHKKVGMESNYPTLEDIPVSKIATLEKIIKDTEWAKHQSDESDW